MAAEKPITNLLADMPENWTNNQIVSSDGTSVGLTKQHGYNYLMKKVNETVKAVNDINDAFSKLTTDKDLQALTALSKKLFLALNPVGSIITTTSGTNPSTIYGGTWKKLDVYKTYGYIQSKVYYGTGVDWLKIYELTDIRQLFKEKYGEQFPDFDYKEVAVTVANGDVTATDRRIIAHEWLGTNLDVLFNAPHSGQIRVECAFFYSGLQSDCEGIFKWKRTS